MKAWFRMDLWKRVMIGLVLGTLIGLCFRYGLSEEGASQAASYFKPFGDLFLNLIRMLVVPLIFLTLVSGVLAMGDPKKLGSLGGRAIGIYMVTTFVAVTIGLIIGTILQPGAGFDVGAVSQDQIEATRAQLESGGAMETVGVFEQIMRTVLAIVPTNIVEAMVNGDVLPIIFFAIMFGIGILLAGEAGKPIADVFNSGAEAILKLTLIVMEVAPFGVLALMAWVMAEYGLDVVVALGMMTLSVYLACVLHILITHGTLLKVVARLPLLHFFGIDPLFFGVLVALNLQTSFLTPPMAMSAYYLKGIAPPGVQLTQIFAGCMPFLICVFIAMALMYLFPQIVFFLPEQFYAN